MISENKEILLSKVEQIQAAQVIIADIDTQLADTSGLTEEQITALNNQKALSQDTIATLQSEIDILNIELLDLDKELQKFNTEYTDIHETKLNTLANMQNRKAEIQDELDSVNNTSNQINNRLIEIVKEKKSTNDGQLKSHTDSDIKRLSLSEEQDAINEEINEYIQERDIIKSKVDTINSEIDGKKDQLKQYEKQHLSKAAISTRSQFLSELGAERIANEEQLIKLREQLDLRKAQEGNLAVKSTGSGYIHYINRIQEGMFIKNSQVVAETSNDIAYSYYIETIINVIDISKVKIGDKVNVAISGVDQNKYGQIEGVVALIDKGSLVTEDGKSFYRMKIDINDYHLESNNGDTIELVRSMQVETRIVYNKETYMDWILANLKFVNK